MSTYARESAGSSSAQSMRRQCEATHRAHASRISLRLRCPRRPRRPRLGGRAPARRQLASRQPLPNWQLQCDTAGGRLLLKPSFARLGRRGVCPYAKLEAAPFQDENLSLFSSLFRRAPEAMNSKCLLGAVDGRTMHPICIRIASFDSISHGTKKLANAAPRRTTHAPVILRIHHQTSPHALAFALRAQIGLIP